MELIKKNMEKIKLELGGSEKYWRISADNILLRKKFDEVLPRYVKGALLDAGAGTLLYRRILSRYCKNYKSLDIEKSHPELDYIDDIQATNLPSEQFDTVFCRNVLEHVPEPRKALAEMHRILKEGGCAIVTVPHLAYLHNEPQDYGRFTKHGIRNIAEKTGFKVVEIDEVGGFFSFMGYIFSTVLLGLTYKKPLIGTLSFYLNYVMQNIFIVLDKITKNEKFLPLNYIVVLEK